MDLQGDVHQAVDVAFSIADLIGSLFADASGKKHAKPRQHFVLGATGEPPSLACSGPAAAVVTVTSPVPLTAGDLDLDAGALPLYAQAIYIPQDSSLPLTNFKAMTQGVFTAALVPVADPGYPVVLMGVNGRNLLNHQAQLTSDLAIMANSAGVTLSSVSGAPYGITLTATSSHPVRSVTHAASIQSGDSSLTIPFEPSEFSASSISTLSYVVTGPFAMLPAAPSNARKNR